MTALRTSGSGFSLPSPLSSRRLGPLSVFLRSFVAFCVYRCPQVITLECLFIGVIILMSTICIGKAVGTANSNVTQSFHPTIRERAYHLHFSEEEIGTQYPMPSVRWILGPPCLPAVASSCFLSEQTAVRGVRTLPSHLRC